MNRGLLMQILKEELRESILQAAEYEFLKHGYKETSMRIIAKRAHTTLGNLYNYYEGKEALFDTLVGEVPEAINRIMTEHEQREVHGEKLKDIKDLEHMLEGADYREMGQEIFLSKRFVILMEGARGTSYEGYREVFLGIMQGHLAKHVGEREGLANMLAHSFLEAILVVAKSQGTIDEAKSELVKYLKILIHGIVGFQK